MDWKDLKNIVSKAAPLLGAAIAGPAGASVGALVSKTLGTDNNPQAVANALKSGAVISGNMDAMALLKKLENQHEQKLLELSLEEAKAKLADTQHAREQNGEHWMPPVLTLVLAIMVAGMFAGILMVEMSAGVENIAYLIAGQVLTAFLTCVAFWMGTSRSSQEKNRLLRKE